MLNIPILRQGNQYQSLDVARVPHHQTREPFVEVSQANAGLIRRDLSDDRSIARARLSRFSTRELVDICTRAADHFTNDFTTARRLDSNSRRLRASGFRDDRSAVRSRASKHAQDQKHAREHGEACSTVSREISTGKYSIAASASLKAAR
jgi:hypothetical protein